MANRKSNQNRKLSFQSLEHRNLMAGNVTVALSNNSLILTGDNQNNAVEVRQVGTNQFSVLGNNGTTINGKASQTFTFTGNLSANFKGGEDSLTLNGNTNGAGSFMTLPGSVNVALGDGANFFDQNNCNITGNLTVSAGSAIDTVYLSGYVGKDCSINLGGGSYNQIQSWYLRVQRDLLINDLTSGNQDIWMDNTFVGRNASIQTGGGTDNVQLDAFFAQGDLDIATGAGDDVVVLGEHIAAYHGKTPDAGTQTYANAAQVSIRMGDGNDQLNVGNVNAYSATFDGGAGDDSLYRDAKSGISLLSQINWQHQYNYGVGVIPSNNPMGKHPTI